jgi:hypothetical protein
MYIIYKMKPSEVTEDTEKNRAFTLKLILLNLNISETADYKLMKFFA